MDIETGDMSIAGHESAIVAIEAKVTALRKEQLTHHDAAEAKRKLIPIVATPNDQVLMPGNASDLVKWAAGLPAAAKALLKKTLGGS